MGVVTTEDDGARVGVLVGCGFGDRVALATAERVGRDVATVDDGREAGVFVDDEAGTGTLAETALTGPAVLSGSGEAVVSAAGHSYGSAWAKMFFR